MYTVEYRKPHTRSSRYGTRKNPLTNVIKNETGLTIEMAVPGISKEDINITLEDEKLIIGADMEKEERNMNREEFNFSQFSRSFYLPEEVDHTQIQATQEDGILKIQLPFKPEEKPQSIIIK